MNLEELRSVQRAERQKDSLQHLDDGFYEAVADYLSQLKDERERAVAAADDPFASDDVRRLTDEIESATEIAEALYERRVGKVVKHASFAAADMATDEEGMTTEERDLFTDLVARIRQNRETVLATLGGTADTGAAGDTTVADVAPTEPTADGEPSTPAERVDPTDPPAESSPADPTDPAPAGGGAEAATDLLADALGGGTVGDGETRGVADSPSDTDDGRADADRPVGEATAVSDGSDETSGTSEASEVEPPGTGPPATATATSTATDDDGSTPDVGSGPERTTLRITADVGTVYGVDDREYDLAREDVVTLPTTNAEPLLRKDAAERID